MKTRGNGRSFSSYEVDVLVVLPGGKGIVAKVVQVAVMRLTTRMLRRPHRRIWSGGECELSVVRVLFLA